MKIHFVWGFCMGHSRALTRGHRAESSRDVFGVEQVFEHARWRALFPELFVRSSRFASQLLFVLFDVACGGLCHFREDVLPKLQSTVGYL